LQDSRVIKWMAYDRGGFCDLALLMGCICHDSRSIGAARQQSHRLPRIFLLLTAPSTAAGRSLTCRRLTNGHLTVLLLGSPGPAQVGRRQRIVRYSVKPGVQGMLPAG